MVWNWTVRLALPLLLGVLAAALHVILIFPVEMDWMKKHPRRIWWIYAPVLVGLFYFLTQTPIVLPVIHLPLNALDYLLKPWSEQRFKKTLQRAREQLQQRTNQLADPKLAALLSQLNASGEKSGRILVKSPERILFLKPDEIDHLEAAGNYVVLHAGKERHIMRETMSAMENRLLSAGFMRINRSVIVNLSRVREVQPLGGGQFSVLLKNGTRLDMTCSLRDLQGRLAGL
jgi:hypothetical protein